MRTTPVAVAACAVLALAGCAQDDTPSPPQGSLPFGTHHVDPKDGMPAAQVLGALKLVDGCLMVEFEEHEYPLVLPDTARWDGSTQELTLDGGTYAMGDQVSWVGGYEHGTDVPESCPTDAEAARVFETS